MKQLLKHSILVAALALVSSSALAGPNLITNGSFEDAGTGWTLNIGLGNDGYSAHTGNYFIGTGCVGHGCVATVNQGSFARQTINTTSGTSYDLSFWVGENAGPTSEFTVFWNGALVADVYNFASNKLASQMVQFTLANLVATSSTSVLEVHGRQDPGGIYFDDFSLVASSDVPEPASLALLGVGLAGAIAARRRKA